MNPMDAGKERDNRKIATDAKAEVAREEAERGIKPKKRGHPWTKNTNQKRNKTRTRMARLSRRANRRK